MAIQARTARQLMYSWHAGQFTALYAAASSGLVRDWDELFSEIRSISYVPDRNRLLEWIGIRRLKAQHVVVQGVVYAVLPWVGRT